MFSFSFVRFAMPPAAALALSIPVAAAQTDIAFTTTNPLVTGSSFDTLQVGPAGGTFTNVPLPTSPDELEFPWDVDFANGRLFVMGYGQDDGTSPTNRTLNATDRGTLWSMNLDGSDPQLLASELDRSPFLDVSPDGSTIYFSQEGSGVEGTFGDDGRVSRLNVATGTVETVVTAPVNGGVTGIDFDPVTGDIFYQVLNRGEDITVNQIRRVNATVTDGTAGSDTLFLENPTPPDGTLDTGAEFTVVSAGRNISVHDGSVYWTWRNSNFDPASEIRRLPIDFDISTDDPEAFETVVTGTRIIDFEIVGDQIYWTDSDINSVLRANLDGTGSPTVVGSGFGFDSLPLGVAVVPEPGTFVALAALGGGLMLSRRRRHMH